MVSLGGGHVGGLMVTKGVVRQQLGIVCGCDVLVSVWGIRDWEAVMVRVCVMVCAWWFAVIDG